MGFVRVYTGDDGQSHFEDMDLLPTDIERSVAQATANITFGRSRNESFSDLAQRSAPPVRYFHVRRTNGGRNRRRDGAEVRSWRCGPVRGPYRTGTH